MVKSPVQSKKKRKKIIETSQKWITVSSGLKLKRAKVSIR